MNSPGRSSISFQTNLKRLVLYYYDNNVNRNLPIVFKHFTINTRYISTRQCVHRNKSAHKRQKLLIWNTQLWNSMWDLEKPKKTEQKKKLPGVLIYTFEFF